MNGKDPVWCAVDNHSSLPDLGPKVVCPRCKRNHMVKYGVDDRGATSKLLAYYSCRGKSYLCGVAGKDITSLVSKE